MDPRPDEINRRVEDANRRMDRLFYAIIGVGGAIVVAIFASRFVGG